MDALTSVQCLQMGRDFSQLQANIADYKLANYNNLSDDQKAFFGKTIVSLADAVGELIAYSVSIAIDEAETSIQNLTTATQQINNIVKTLENVQKWINIAGACFGLATAILELNPKDIYNGIKDIAKCIGDMESKKKNG